MGYSTTPIDLQKAKMMIRKKRMQLVAWSNGRNTAMIGAKYAEITDHNPPRIIVSWASYPPDFITFEQTGGD